MHNNFIHFNGRNLPSIFSIFNPSEVNIGYDDNIIGDERYVITGVSRNARTFVIRVVKSPHPIIALRQLGINKQPIVDRSILLNEDISVYSDSELEYIRRTIRFCLEA